MTKETFCTCGQNAQYKMGKDFFAYKDEHLLLRGRDVVKKYPVYVHPFEKQIKRSPKPQVCVPEQATVLVLYKNY